MVGLFLRCNGWVVPLLQWFDSYSVAMVDEPNNSQREIQWLGWAQKVEDNIAVGRSSRSWIFLNCHQRVCVGG